MSYIDKSLPLEKRIWDDIYGKMCSVIYVVALKAGKQVSVDFINKSEEIKEWADMATKEILGEIEATK